MKTHVLIGVPMRDDHLIDAQMGVFCGIMSVRNSMSLHMIPSVEPAYGRNHIVEMVLKNKNVSHLFFLDSDTRPPIDAIDRLLAHDKDIIAGVTPMYFDKTKYVSVGVEAENGEHKWLKYDELLARGPGIFRAKAIGGTTVLIKRAVLEALEYPYFDVVYRPGGVRIGEDIYFVNKVYESGFDIWVDPTIICGHMKYNDLRDWFKIEGK